MFKKTEWLVLRKYLRYLAFTAGDRPPCDPYEVQYYLVLSLWWSPSCDRCFWPFDNFSRWDLGETLFATGGTILLQTIWLRTTVR